MKHGKELNKERDRSNNGALEGKMPRRGKRKEVGPKMPEKLQAAARKTELLPHEILLAVAQGRAKEVLGCEVTDELRLCCLRAAAPYFPTLH